jgi:hypothetical protein
MHAHSVQDAILSEIGDGWVNAREIAWALRDRWGLSIIEHQLRYFVREGILWIRRDARRKRFLEPAYARVRSGVELGDPLIGGRGRLFAVPHVVLADPVEAFQHADPA